MKQIALIIIVILSVQNTCNIKKIDVIDIDEFIHSYKQGPFDEDFIKDFYTDIPDSNFYISIYHQTSTHFIGYSGLFMSRRFEEHHVFDSIALFLRNKSLLQSSFSDTAHCFMLNSESYDKLNDKSKIPIPDYHINFSGYVLICGE